MMKQDQIYSGFARTISQLGQSQVATIRRFYVSSRSIQRWAKKERDTGNFMPNRRRRSIFGVIPKLHQDILMIANADHPDFYYQELANVLEVITGINYSARLLLKSSLAFRLERWIFKPPGRWRVYGIDEFSRSVLCID